MHSFTEGGLVVTVDGSIVRLKFDRPECLNAIDVAMARAFHKAATAIAAHRSVRAVAMSGAGRAFTATALAFGLVNRVVPAASRAAELTRCCAGSPTDRRSRTARSGASCAPPSSATCPRR
jgi:enoyl-CoA hydratase/carnithine racemase